MARIPDGSQFGNVVARPGPMVQQDPAAYGEGTARALTQAGQVGMQMANQSLAQDQAERKHAAAVAAAEAKQLAREQAAEAKAAAKEANRVKALVTTAKVQGGLASLHDQLQADLESGAIDKADVGTTWQERSKSLMDESLQTVDPEHRDLVGATLLNDVGRYGQSVTKMVTQRDKKDILTGGLSYFEEMQRHAARGPQQADEAIANVRAFWTATGPMAGEDPATASLRVQRFTENVRQRQATDLVNADPGAALKALKNRDYLPELDPGVRAGLVQSADSAVLRNQQRSALNAEAAARAQTKAWEGAQTVFQAGKVPTPEYAAQLVKTFKGTPYESALKSMMADGPGNSAFAAQPVAQQAAALTVIQNKLNQGGATPEEIKNYERMDKVHKATIADLKEDPYKAASERGVLPDLQPLTLDMATLPQQLAKRAQAANVVSQFAGQEVSLFRPDEANKVAGILQALPPKDRAGALSGLSQAMTPAQMRAFGKQLGAKDDTLAAAALMAANGAKTTNGRQVAEIALTGADALKEDRVKFPSGQSKTSIRAEIDKATRGAYLSEDAQRAAGDAAFSVYAGLVAEGQSPDVGQAVRLATGGVMELNGTKFVKPYGWEDSRVTKTLKTIDAAKVSSFSGGKQIMVGGQPITPEDLAKHMPNATLGPSPRGGSYTVSVGGRMVTSADGKPLLVPLGGM